MSAAAPVMKLNELPSPDSQDIRLITSIYFTIQQSAYRIAPHAFFIGETTRLRIIATHRMHKNGAR